MIYIYIYIKIDLLSYTDVFTCVLAFGCITTFLKEMVVFYFVVPAVADAG